MADENKDQNQIPGEMNDGAEAPDAETSQQNVSGDPVPGEENPPVVSPVDALSNGTGQVVAEEEMPVSPVVEGTESIPEEVINVEQPQEVVEQPSPAEEAVSSAGSEPVVQPVSPLPAPPKPPSKPKNNSGGGVSAMKVLVGFLIVGFVLLLIFYVLLLWSLMKGDLNNALFALLGMKPSQLKDTLLVLTNSIFGFWGVITLVATLIKTFQWFLVGKNAINRKDYLKGAGIAFFFFVLVAVVWFSLVRLIEATPVVEGGEDLADTLILSDPANLVGITAPVTVTFDVGKKLFQQVEEASVRQISWDLNGDGAIDGAGPKVTYRYLNKGVNNGRFNVTAKVYYFSAAEKIEKVFETRREVIINNEAIQAVITANPDGGPVPQDISFSAGKSVDPDGDIVLYEWDMENDGEFEIRGENEVQVQRSFNQVGEFTVGLRVTGRNNDTSFIRKTVNITLPEGNLRAEINAAEGFEGVSPFKVTLDGSQSFSKMGKIVKYEWYVEGESKPVVGRTIQRIFDEPGDYKVSLMVENDLGERHKINQTMKVLDRRVKVELQVKTTPQKAEDGILTGSVPLKVTFDPTKSKITDPVEWRWDFENDGTVDSFNQIANHVFREPGNYEVKLIVLDAFGDSFEATQRVVVRKAGVQAKIAASPTSGTVPLKVHFDGSGSSSDIGDIITYVWKFPGQEPVHYGAEIDYQFEAVGVFEVDLTVVTEKGEESTDSLLVSVREQVIQAHFVPEPEQGSAPLEVLFNPVTSSGVIESYQWDFGDGNTSDEIVPLHVYENPGTYEVTLRVKDENGLVSEVKKTVQVVDEFDFVEE